MKSLLILLAASTGLPAATTYVGGVTGNWGSTSSWSTALVPGVADDVIIDSSALAVTLTSNELHRIRAITERWSVEQRWSLILTRVLRRWLGGKWLPGLPEEAELLLSG